MKKVLVAIIVLVTLFRSGSLAQSLPNGFDMALDKKSKEVRCVSCGENGFCVVEEAQSRKYHRLRISHVDTAMRLQWDTTITLLQESRFQQVFYEDGTLVVMVMPRVTPKVYWPGPTTIYLYHTAFRKLETREVADLHMVIPIADCHYYQGNFIFKTVGKNSDGVWFLPVDAAAPVQFTFTKENPGRVLSLDVDTLNGCVVICFNSGVRTMYFETDFHGKSSFANIIGEPSTQAQWIPISRNHSVLMLYYNDQDNFFMHPVNILNHKVMPSDTLFCADILVPNIQPMGAKAMRTIIVVPHNYVSLYPTYAGFAGDKIFCVTELYCPEYSNYFNGQFVEPRFDGYRYDRADVHFFDTNGVFITNTTFPYGEEMSLRTSVYKVLNVSFLPNSDILLYYLDTRNLSTMLLDSVFEIKSPVNTVGVPIQRNSSSGRYKTVPVAMQQWYGNRFLLTAYLENLGSQRKVGISVRKMEYN